MYLSVDIHLRICLWYFLHQLVEYLHARSKETFCRFRFHSSIFHYTSTMFRTSLFFRLFGATLADSIEWSSLSFFVPPPPSTISSSYLTVSPSRVLAPLSHFWLSRGHLLFLAPRSSSAPRARDAECCLPNSCIRVFLTGHRAFDRTWSNRTLRSAELTRIPFPLYSALSPRFLSTSRFSDW